MKLLEKIKYTVKSATLPHERGIPKPNEDRLLIDEEKNIFIILDGVTRPHGEYYHSPYKSYAADMGDIFIKEAYAYLSEHIDDPNPMELLYAAARAANGSLAEYCKNLDPISTDFYPSTLGIISFIRDKRLYYLCAGDCMGIILRGKSKITFGKQLVLEAVDLLGVSKTERYAHYCNHPEGPLSYAVFNGSREAIDGLDYSFIDLCEGDILFLCTDGIANYLKYERNTTLSLQSPEEIISMSKKYDRPPFAAYADDKTLIKICL